MILPQPKHLNHCRTEKHFIAELRWSNNLKCQCEIHPVTQIQPGWWFQPLWNIWVKMDEHFPKHGIKYIKIFETTNQKLPTPHPPHVSLPHPAPFCSCSSPSARRRIPMAMQDFKVAALWRMGPKWSMIGGHGGGDCLDLQPHCKETQKNTSWTKSALRHVIVIHTIHTDILKLQPTRSNMQSRLSAVTPNSLRSATSFSIKRACSWTSDAGAY